MRRLGSSIVFRSSMEHAREYSLLKEDTSHTMYCWAEFEEISLHLKST